MAYDELLAARIREALPGHHQVEEKKMMGGLTFMVNGKMCVGIFKGDLMCRIDPAIYETALGKKGCMPMEFSGRRMKGFVLVGKEGIRTAKDFDYWINLSLEFNKKAKASRKSRK